MTEFLSFFIVLLAAVFFSALFNRLHLPWVIALITAGVVIGPHGLNILTPGPTVTFLGQIGLVFLMFMAGLETRLSALRKNAHSITVLALLNGLAPAAVGMVTTLAFGYDLQAALLIGIVFISTSIAVVIPSMETHGIFHTRLGQVTVGATIVEDVISLGLFSILLQHIHPASSVPLWLHYVLLLLTLVALRLLVPRVWRFLKPGNARHGLFQHELRLVVVFLLGIVIIFELLGLHPIIAGFLSGLVLSELITSNTLREKIHAVSYGLFIPIFFVLVGTRMDIHTFRQTAEVAWLTGAIIGGFIVVKFLSGWLAGRLTDFGQAQSLLIGAATTPSLVTTLAIAFTGLELGVLDQNLVTALVLLSIVTVIIGPAIIALSARRVAKVTIIKHSPPRPDTLPS